MTKKWAVVTAIGGLAVLVAGCSSQPSANDASCKIFANSYNAYIISSNQFAGAHTTANANLYISARDSMAKDFSDAYAKASGDVAVALKDAKDSAALMSQAVNTNASVSDQKDALGAFQLSVDDVAKKCEADGVKLSLQQRDTPSPEPTSTATVYHFHNP
jgi:hypothetical protein